MYQRDFILRIIEQIAQFIARLLNLYQDDRTEEAYDMMIKHSGKLMGLSYAEIQNRTAEEVMDVLVRKHISSDYLDTMGRFFMVAAELCLNQQKDDEAIRHIELSRLCFQEAMDRFQTYSFERQVDLEKLGQLKIRVGMGD